MIQELFRSLPETYITRLDKFKSEKDIWLRSASLLLQRQTDLKRLRVRTPHLYYIHHYSNLSQDHVKRHDDRTSSKYHTLSTERLSAFCDAKFRDLLNDYWHGDEGLSALNLLKELAGLTPTPSPFVQATFNPKSTDPLRHKQTNTQASTVHVYVHVYNKYSTVILDPCGATIPPRSSRSPSFTHPETREINFFVPQGQVSSTVAVKGRRSRMGHRTENTRVHCVVWPIRCGEKNGPGARGCPAQSKEGQ